MAVDRIGVIVAGLRRRKVSHDLVAEQVEVDPGGGAAPFGTSKHAAVEGAGFGEVIDRKSDMEGCEGHGMN